MKSFIIIVLGIFIMPVALFGYALLTYRQNRQRASRFYNRPGYPHDNGTAAPG
jgi:membrane protein required for beta-lactamase induction